MDSKLLNNESVSEVTGDIIWAERSHSPPTVRDYQRLENKKRWKKLSDWAETIFSKERLNKKTVNKLE